MRFKTLITLFFVALVGSSYALAKTETLAQKINKFASDAQYRGIKLSPDGRYVAVSYRVKNNEVKMAIMTADMKKVLSSYGFGKNKYVTNILWVGPKRLIFSISKVTGWLDNHGRRTFMVATNIDGSKRVRVNESQNFRIIDPLVDQPRWVLVGKFREHMTLMKLNTFNAKMRNFGGLPWSKVKPGIINADTDTHTIPRFAVERDRGSNTRDWADDTTSLYYRPRKGSWKRVTVDVKRPRAQFNPLGFGIKDRFYYFTSNFDMTKDDTLGLFRLDTDNGAVKLVYRNPDVDVLGAASGPNGAVLGYVYEAGYPVVKYFDKTEKYTKIRLGLERAFKQQSVSVRFTTDGKQALVVVSSDRDPGEYYLFDTKHNKVRYLASVMPHIRAHDMAHVEPFTMVTRDGVKLYGQLTMPRVKSEKNLPMVVMPHGGPFGIKDDWGFNRDAQMLASVGYLVLQVNYRGSGGYGQDFERSGWLKWGLEMQDDITDATLWAVKQGLADKNRLCIYGGSYGGYAALEAVVKEPDLYKCAIPDAGVYSLPLMWKTGDSLRYDYNGATLFLRREVGSDEADMEARSPAYHVDKIKAALFFIHGRNDVRVPIAHLKLTLKNLDQIGKPYQTLIRDEGHGFTQKKNRIEQYREMLQFLQKNIGKGAAVIH